MSQTIRFMESLGSKPAFGKVSAADYANAVGSLEVGDEERQALLDRNVAALGDLLGGRPAMACMVWAPDQEPMRKEDDQSDTEQPVEEESPATE
ncbi:hypothetical protein [Pseudoxanthomonas sp. UTMC 1351]|uniref:hypothetical protein n=1 Tax=Pseudoxanthomonas sp. UTMC 1351 TaxID=2695853 RepID=UPI0034CD5396